MISHDEMMGIIRTEATDSPGVDCDQRLVMRVGARIELREGEWGIVTQITEQGFHYDIYRPTRIGHGWEKFNTHNVPLQRPDSEPAPSTRP